MRQWKSLVPALHLHGPVASCFPHPPPPSPPRGDDEETDLLPAPPSQAGAALAVRLVGCDGRVPAYAPPVTTRELMQEHLRHLVCRADALLIGERIPAVAAAEELQPGEAYFLLPAHLFCSVLSFVSLTSSLLLLLSTTASSASGKKPAAGRPFELHRMASGTLQIKFSSALVRFPGHGATAPRHRPPRFLAFLAAPDRPCQVQSPPSALLPRWPPDLPPQQAPLAAARSPYTQCRLPVHVRAGACAAHPSLLRLYSVARIRAATASSDCAVTEQCLLTLLLSPASPIPCQVRRRPLPGWTHPVAHPLHRLRWIRRCRGLPDRIPVATTFPA
jgi:hypothetical protein